MEGGYESCIGVGKDWGGGGIYGGRGCCERGGMTCGRRSDFKRD